ncbi:hypothetical protein TNCV_2231341 [Trichonephila clavipes]|nr:hypothetical protein TNCV_2231341 [Trichonephila clavipes]
MFADDTAIITQNKRFSVVISNLQHYISLLELWLTDWKIKVNASKSACLMFMRRTHLPVGLTPVTIFGQPVSWELWFQQDGATCHTARATIDLLKDTFGDRLISRFGPVNWPPRSCDLTPLDYFLWVYVKSLVYADKPQTLDPLEDNIRHVIADIRPQMLEKIIENSTSRLDSIRASRGSHMPEIIFKICEPFSMIAGGYNFAFRGIRDTFASSELDVTLRKRSKVIALNEHSSMDVRDLSMVVAVGKSSISRF